MTINDLPVKSAVRRPRSIVEINGIGVAGWDEWQTDNNAYYQADTFRLVFVISAMPAEFGLDFWAEEEDFYVELFEGFPADASNFTKAELTSRFYGRADDMTVDMVAGTITLIGRDLTARMIDEKSYEKHPNLTSSEIAEKIAKQHNLDSAVVPTTTKAGTYYEIDHARLESATSQWDLLTALAQNEGYQVYVHGRTLYFEPKAEASDDPYVLEWIPPNESKAYPEFNGKRLFFSRNMSLSRDVIVTVKSWNSKNKKVFTETARATHKRNRITVRSRRPLTEPQTYAYTIPGLTPEQALQKAQALLEEITSHEIRVEGSLPGDDLLSARNVLQVRGTKSGFDTTYFIDSVIRTMSVREGYTMDFRAKNHSPESTVAL